MLHLSGGKLIVLFAGAVGATIVGGGVAAGLALVFDLKHLSSTLHVAALALLPFAALLAWVYLWCLKSSGGYDPLFGLSLLSRRWAALSVAGGFVAAGASTVVVLLTRPWLGAPRNVVGELADRGGEVTLPLIVVLLLLAAVLAPLSEELLFRGALYPWLRRHLGILPSAFVAALPHTLLHVDPALFPPLIIVFAWFGLLLEWSGNIWVPILAHATNNTLAILLVLWQLG